MSDFAWYLSEYGRDKQLASEIEESARATRQLGQRTAKATSELRNELKSLSGSLNHRLEVLTSSFLAFVELDGIRQQLAGFPGHTEARRQALADLKALADGELPQQADDVEGYWLPPAVAALRPDGGVDAERAAVAMERDPEAAVGFLTAARAALGQGAAVVGNLADILEPTDGAWDEDQLTFLAGVFRGGFGPDALASLSGVFTKILDAETPDEWLKWAIAQADEAELPRSEIGAAHWVADELEKLAAESGAAVDSSWRVTRPVGAPDFVSPDGDDAGEEAEPEQVAVAPADEWGETRDLLLGLAGTIAARGAANERALVARMEELQAQLADPLSKHDPAETTSSKPALAILRETVVDGHASRNDRRLLWNLIGPRFRGWAENALLAKPAENYSVTVRNSDLAVDYHGVDQSAVKRESQRLAKVQSAGAVADHPTAVMGVGAGMAALGVVLLIVAPALWWAVLVLVGGGTLWYGNQLRRDRADAETAASLRVSKFLESVADAEQRVEKWKASESGHAEQSVEAGQRLLAAIGPQ